MRGPASLLFGANPPGGAINAITKRPTFEPQGEVWLRVGALNRLGIAADVSGPVDAEGTVAYRLVASDEQQKLPTPDTDKRQRYIAPALSFRWANTTELTLLANYEQTRINGDAYPYSYYEPFGRYVPGAEKGWDRFNRDTWSAGYVLDHRFNNDLSFHSRSRYSRVTLDYRNTYAADFVSADVVSRETSLINDSAKVWQTDNYVQGQWTMNSWGNTTIAGVDVSRVEGALYRGRATTSDYDLITGQGIGTFIEPNPVAEFLDVARQVGAYVQNQTKIDNRFVVLAGLRKDWYRSDATGTAAALNPTVSSDKASGRVGGVWLLPNGMSPYVSYATSFQPVTGSDRSGNRFEPTTGRQYEVGVRYEPIGVQAQFSAALFDIAQQNVLTVDPDDANFQVQRGEVGSRGLELEATASLGSGLNLTSSYSYTDARVTKDTNAALVGKKNAGVPRHKVAAWLNARVLSDSLPGLRAGLGVRYNSKVPDAANTYWVPSVTLVDARLSYQLARWEFALNARNLFDKNYLVNCSTGGTCYPGDQREVMGTLTYRW